MNIKFGLKTFCLISSFLCFTSCMTKSISELTPDEGITQIQKSFDDKEWLIVINSVNEYKTRYPYSELNVKAEIMQADALFESARYAESIAVYNDFIKKNPDQDKVPYAQYRIAKSYDAQAPNNVDRDQGNSNKALRQYIYFIEHNSDSKWIDDAKTRKDILNRRIAEHNKIIADFYWHHNSVSGALSRYLIIIKNFSQYQDLLQIAKIRSKESYLKLAEILEKKPDSDGSIFFKNETPQSLREKANLIAK